MLEAKKVTKYIKTISLGTLCLICKRKYSFLKPVRSTSISLCLSTLHLSEPLPEWDQCGTVLETNKVFWEWLPNNFDSLLSLKTDKYYGLIFLVQSSLQNTLAVMYTTSKFSLIPWSLNTNSKDPCPWEK